MLFRALISSSLTQPDIPGGVAKHAGRKIFFKFKLALNWRTTVVESRCCTSMQDTCDYQTASDLLCMCMSCKFGGSPCFIHANVRRSSLDHRILTRLVDHAVVVLCKASHRRVLSYGTAAQMKRVSSANHFINPSLSLMIWPVARRNESSV
jgi:hypothetical protein